MDGAYACLEGRAGCRICLIVALRMSKPLDDALSAGHGDSSMDFLDRTDVHRSVASLVHPKLSPPSQKSGKLAWQALLGLCKPACAVISTLYTARHDKHTVRAHSYDMEIF